MNDALDRLSCLTQRSSVNIDFQASETIYPEGRSLRITTSIDKNINNKGLVKDLYYRLYIFTTIIINSIFSILVTAQSLTGTIHGFFIKYVVRMVTS